jgi:hypothetical protein
VRAACLIFDSRHDLKIDHPRAALLADNLSIASQHECVPIALEAEIAVCADSLALGFDWQSDYVIHRGLATPELCSVEVLDSIQESPELAFSLALERFSGTMRLMPANVISLLPKNLSSISSCSSSGA